MRLRRQLFASSTKIQLLCLLVLALHLTSLTTSVVAQDAATSTTTTTTNQFNTYRSAGDRLLSRGELQGALRAYNSALDLDPDSFIIHHKRATVYMSLGRHQQALQDLEALLKLKPDYHAAHLLKAKLYAKEGSFEEGEKEVNIWLKHNKNDQEGKELQTALSHARNSLKHARQALKNQQYDRCLDYASEALRIGPNSLEAREIRVSCFEAYGDVDNVLADLSRLTHLVPSSTELPVKLAYLFYFLRNDAERALSHLKQCLHYDPDSKTCKGVNRLIRGLEKEATRARNFLDAQQWKNAISVLLGGTSDGKEGLIAKFDEQLDLAIQEGHLPESYHPRTTSQARVEFYAWTCRSYVRLGHVNGMKQYCLPLLEMHGGESFLDPFIAKGEIANSEENWEQAVHAFSDAFERSGRSSQDILNRLQKAQKLLKQSKSKDYYKILDVPRDADVKAIKKAYRKLAKKNHPDIGGSEEKMAQLNEAYEVLSNPELKARFDAGDDPNEPAGQGGGNPFHHFGGGHPFGQFFQQGQGFQQFMFQQGGGRQAGGGGGGGGGQKMFFQFQQG